MEKTNLSVVIMCALKKIRKKYYEIESQDVYKSPILDSRYQHVRRMYWIKKFLKIMPHHLFLDVGCGRGYYLSYASKLAKHTVGIDIAKTTLSNTKKLLKNADFIVCDAEHLPFRASTFNYVLCSELIEHLLHPLKAFKELVRVSSEYIILTTIGPGHAGYRKLLSRFRSQRLTKQPLIYYQSLLKSKRFGGGHIWYLAPRHLVQVAKKSGLKIDNIAGSGAAFFPLQEKLLNFAYGSFSTLFFFIDEAVDPLPFFKYAGKYTVIRFQKPNNN